MTVKIIQKMLVEGKTQIEHANGEIEEETELVEEVIVDKPMANVGLKVGMTKNMGNYESIRVDISLFIPSELDEESLNAAFKKCDEWCEKRMKRVMEELKEVEESE